MRVFFSYDYELLWGVWDGTGEAYARTNVALANRAAGGLVGLHKKYHIAATFAVVGAMFKDASATDIFREAGRTEEDIQRLGQLFVPKASNKKMTSASSKVMSELISNPLFELASHTYSHFYALDASVDLIKKDFDCFEKLMKSKFNVTPTSLVMPKNQMTKQVLSIAEDFGFKIVRMNPDSWLYRPVKRVGTAKKIVRILRYLDTYVPLLEMFIDRSAGVQRKSRLRVNRGQYFIRPLLRYRIMNWFHLQRLKLGFHLCRVGGRDCHYWSHPHNFGRNPEVALNNYEHLLIWLKKQEEKGRVTFALMQET